MTVVSGAHILLDDDEFQIDETVEGHYKHRFFDLVSEQTDTPIPGAPAKKSLLTDTLLWGYEDWGGGEGNRIYYEDMPDVYDVAYELNPRNRGQLTGRPLRQMQTLTASDVTKRPVAAVGDGALWVGSDDRVHWTTDGTTWTSPSVADTGLNALDAGYFVTAMTGDGEYMYYAGWTSDTSGTRVIFRIKGNATDDVGVILKSEQTVQGPWGGLTMMNGKLYAWNGRKLLEADDPGQTTMPLSAAEDRVVYDAGSDPANKTGLGNTWWADCFATENSVIMFYSTQGVGKVYEFKKKGRPIWTSPYGFTIKSGCYQNGVLLFFGHWGGDTSASGWGAVYAIPLDSLRPINLGEVRRYQGSNLHLEECSPSYGDQVMLSDARTGRVFIYDASDSAFSMLDELKTSTGDSMVFVDNDERIGAMITYGPLRYVIVYNPSGGASTALQVVAYSDDEPANREVTLNTTQFANSHLHLETPKFDNGYPMELKTLIGFHLTFTPLVANQTIKVLYSLDDAGALETDTGWTSLADVTSATSGASAGRVFQTVSVAGTQKKYFQMKFRVRLTSAAGIAAPILYGSFAESKLIRKREEWEIVVRIKDEQTRNRPSNRQAQAKTLRDWLEATIEAGNVVTFRDGYRYKDRKYGEAQFTTHNVIIKEAEDDIRSNAEGTMRLRLIATTEAT